MHKPYAVIISVAYTLFVLGVSFIDLDDLSQLDTSRGDKIAHAGIYFLLVLVWYVAFLPKAGIHPKKYIPRISITVFIFGTIIEVLQSSLTTHRTADVLDIVANTIGVGLASLLLWRVKINVKK